MERYVCTFIFLESLVRLFDYGEKLVKGRLLLCFEYLLLLCIVASNHALEVANLL